MTTSSEERSRGQSPEALLARPRWARVRRVQLIRREVREYLSPTAVELLLSEGDIVIEGGLEVNGADRVSGCVYATAMVTTDLADLAGRLRDRADAWTAARIADLLAGHPELPPRLAQRVRTRLPELSGELSGTPSNNLGVARWNVTVDPHVRAEGTAVLIDADIVASPADVEVG